MSDNLEKTATKVFEKRGREGESCRRQKLVVQVTWTGDFGILRTIFELESSSVM